MYTNNGEIGKIKIANEVLATIASIAASEVDGIAGMSGTGSQGLADLLRFKNLTKGVRVQFEDDLLILDLFVIIDYKAKLPEVALKVQENVKKALESMTGLIADEINVHIQGVKLQKDEKGKDPIRV